MIYFYYLTNVNKVFTSKNIYGLQENAILLGSYDKRLPQTYNYWLKPYKMVDNTYMFSEELLKIIARIVKKDYEDLWNLIFLRSDRSKKSGEEFFSSREEELVSNIIGIFNYDV